MEYGRIRGVGSLNVGKLSDLLVDARCVYRGSVLVEGCVRNKMDVEDGRTYRPNCQA